MKASEIDRIFDEGKEDVLHHFDPKSARRPGHEPTPLNLECPDWMARALDREARRLGVTRDDMIRLWLAEKLEKKA